MAVCEAQAQNGQYNKALSQKTEIKKKMDLSLVLVAAHSFNTSTQQADKG